MSFMEPNVWPKIYSSFKNLAVDCFTQNVLHPADKFLNEYHILGAYKCALSSPLLFPHFSNLT